MSDTGITRKIVAFLQLTKPLITFSVAFTSLTGFILAQRCFAEDWFLVTLGVFLLSAGSAALNHVQEVEPDSLMTRTQNRPIPSGKISPIEALIFSILLIVSGLIILTFLKTQTTLILGIITLLWYNLVYTWLKKKTAFAVVPGSLVGAIPPIMGWTAGGGSITDFRIILVAFFFYVGQMPHFWLILLRYGKQYERAGFPSITRLFSKAQIANLTLVWVYTTAMAAILPVLFGVIGYPLLRTLAFLLAIILVIIFSIWHPRLKTDIARFPFLAINLFYLAVMLIFITDALLR